MGRWPLHTVALNTTHRIHFTFRCVACECVLSCVRCACGCRWMIDLPDDDSLEATRSATLSMLRTLLFTGQTMLPLDRAVRAGDDPCCYLVMKISHEGGEPLELKGFQLSEEDSALFADETVKVRLSEHFES